MAEPPQDKDENKQENQDETPATPDQAQEKAPPPRKPDFGAGKQIILVDDDPTSLELVKSILEKAAFKVITSTNAELGWEKITPEVTPNLIITDVLMSGMAGLGFVKELKNNDETERIPILVISERKKMGDTFLALGADAFISKPLNTEEFLDQVDKLSSRPISKKKKSEAPPAEDKPAEKKEK